MSPILDHLKERYVEMATESEGGIGKLRPRSRDLSSGLKGYGGNHYWWTRWHKDDFICFANINLPEEEQGKGIFTGLLDYIEANPHNFKGIEVESTTNPRLIEYLRRRGWEDNMDRVRKLDIGFIY